MGLWLSIFLLLQLLCDAQLLIEQENIHGLRHVTFTEKLIWCFRLCLGRRFRFYIHLPIISSDENGKITKIPADVRIWIINQIERYFERRSANGEIPSMSMRQEGARFKGHPEVNLVIYFDWKYSLSDIQWLYERTRHSWRIRLSQEVLYLTWRRSSVRSH